MSEITKLEQAFIEAQDFESKVALMQQVQALRVQEAQEVIQAIYKEGK